MKWIRYVKLYCIVFRFASIRSSTRVGWLSGKDLKLQDRLLKFVKQKQKQKQRQYGKIEIRMWKNIVSTGLRLSSRGNLGRVLISSFYGVDTSE